MSETRSQAELLLLMTKKVVAYRLAMLEAMTELTPRACGSCRKAADALDRVEEYPPTS